MGIQIQGLDRLMNKLNKLDNIKGKDAVEKVAVEVENNIKRGASFAPNASNYIRKCEVRDYGKAYFVDIGLKNDDVPFDLWRNVWFHNWGYWQYYFGYKTGNFTNMHMMWFNNSVNSMGDEVIGKLKSELKVEIKKCLQGER